jgi:lipopolysaccharide/colanic/teichoic acid biosynthesis glycosyltransferase
MSSLFNKALGGIAVIIFSPCLVVLSLLVFSIDGRPIFFIQKRLGYRKREFDIFKFRTMKDGTVTKLGRWLRKTGLDELPQLFNIILGDINVVGPRPITLSDRKRFGYCSKKHLKRWTVKPGLTGLSQTRGCRDTISSWTSDQEYINIRSIWLDFKIILVTFLMNILGKQLIRKLMKRLNFRFLVTSP